MAAALHSAKRLLGLRQPSHKCPTASQQGAAAGPAADGWSIKAFFKTPRSLPGSAAFRRAPRRARAEPAAPAVVELVAAPPLQTALSIQPMAPQADSLDALLADGTQRASSKTVQAQPARGNRQGRRTRRPVEHWTARLRGGARVAAAPGGHTSAASSRPASEGTELATLMRHISQQAALLAECGACAAGMQQQMALVQGQLDACEAELAAVERQTVAAAAAAAAAEQEALGAEAQTDALQHELVRITTAAAAERVRLEQAAARCQDRADGLEGVARERTAAAAGWQRRVQLMEATHVPLSPREQARREEAERKYWAPLRQPGLFDD